MSDYTQINNIFIQQNLNGIIPFTYFGEDKFNSATDNSSLLKFSFRTSNQTYLNYNNILNPKISEETKNTVFMPETEDSKFTTSPIFYVDLVTEDKSGISEFSLRGQTELYEKRTPKYTFIIPKFTWDTSLITNDRTAVTGLTNAIGSVWVGTNDNVIYKIEYSDKNVLPIYAIDTDSEVENILFDKESNLMFLTTYDHLTKYSVDHYINNTNKYVLDVGNEIQKYNDNNKKMVLFQDNELWSTVSYLGKIVKQDKDTLLETDELTGLDAPFKIIKSDYHDCYFISGTNILWKYDGVSELKIIYEINDYSISDFDVGKNGEIIILFNGITDAILRILDKNFYRILFNEHITNGKFRFCKYCSTNKFYAIGELDSGTYDYSLSHYLYDLTSGTNFSTISNNNVSGSEGSSSVTPALQKIEVVYPNGNETLIFNRSIDIKWKSTESVNDKIKIELYKSTELYETIVESTENTGIYKWTIPDTLDIASDYKIQITWVAPSPNEYSDLSNNYFTISDHISSSSGPLSPVIDVGNIAGIDFDTYNNKVVSVMKDGYLGYFDTILNKFTGLFDIGYSNISCIGVRDERIKEFNTITKVRIFVGSAPYLSDKWDSGEIETNLTSIYYGGGNNLVSGSLYYVNIQVYSENTGWSEVQTRKFNMP